MFNLSLTQHFNFSSNLRSKIRYAQACHFPCFPQTRLLEDSSYMWISINPAYDSFYALLKQYYKQQWTRFLISSFHCGMSWNRLSLPCQWTHTNTSRQISEFLITPLNTCCTGVHLIHKKKRKGCRAFWKSASLGCRKKVSNISDSQTTPEKQKRNPQLFGTGGPKDPWISKLVGLTLIKAKRY